MTKDGISKANDEVNAILKAERPTNISEVRSFKQFKLFYFMIKYESSSSKSLFFDATFKNGSLFI